MPTTSRLSTKLSWCDTAELPQLQGVCHAQPAVVDGSNRIAGSGYGEFCRLIDVTSGVDGCRPSCPFENGQWCDELKDTCDSVTDI